GITVLGADAGNYNYPSNSTATAAADIAKRNLNVWFTAANRPYDGTTAAPVTESDDRLSGDVITVTYSSAFFADKNVGTDKRVTVIGITVKGVDVGNYAYSTSPADKNKKASSTTAGTTTISTVFTTASITKISLNLVFYGVNKVYDGKIDAKVTQSDKRVSGDDITVLYDPPTFITKDVGTAKPVTVTRINVTGPDKGNYNYTPNSTATTAANITALTLLVNWYGVDKPYDGTTAATVTHTDNKVPNDDLNVTYNRAFFDD